MSYLFFLARSQPDSYVLEGASLVNAEKRSIGFTDCADVWVNAAADDWNFLSDQWFDGKLFETCSLVPCKSHEGLTADFGSMFEAWKKGT